MNSIAFFNNKAGVGKTSLVYHLAWMFADLGIPVLAADLDPQANLTSMFLDEERLESLWPDEDEHPSTVYGAVRPILQGIGDIAPPPVEWIARDLGLLPGDLGLARFEDTLSCRNHDEPSLRATTAFYRLLKQMSNGWAKLVLIDLGPNLGAINRAALIAADHVCVPFAPGPYTARDLKNFGSTLTQWRDAWSALKSNDSQGHGLPSGGMRPAGFVVTWRPLQRTYPLLTQVPTAYRTHVLNQPLPESMPQIADDPNCLAQLKHSRSLLPLAMEAHKPVFALTPADGAIGAHAEAVRQSKTEFLRLANAIAAAVGLPMPSTAI